MATIDIMRVIIKHVINGDFRNPNAPEYPMLNIDPNLPIALKTSDLYDLVAPRDWNDFYQAGIKCGLIFRYGVGSGDIPGTAAIVDFSNLIRGE